MPKKKRSVRRYTEAEKITAISVTVECGSLVNASRQLGIPVKTLNRWYYDPKYKEKKIEFQKIRDDLSENVKTYMESRQKRVFGILDKILDRLFDDDRLDSATYSQLTTAFGTLIDKYAVVKAGTDGDADESGVIILPEIEGGDDVGDGLETAGETGDIHGATRR